MSIPPLVCITPPPPDQCEDDKDPEDYDLQYNHSLEDDEGIDYDYGNFSTYTHYESQISQKKSQIKYIDEKIEEGEMNATQNKTSSENDTIEINACNKCIQSVKSEEDINVEDLNLEVSDQSTDTTSKDTIKDNKFVSKEGNHSLKERSEEILNNDSNQEDNYNMCSPTCSYKESTTQLEENIISESESIVDEVIEINNAKTVSNEDDIAPKSLETPLNDDFGDFDEFQFIRTNPKPMHVNNTNSDDNPWENKVAENSDFGDFTAYFDDSETKSNDIIIQNVEKASRNYNDDQLSEFVDESDCGDFDDFKSSNTLPETNIAQQEELKSGHSVNVLNLQSSDNETLVMENLNKLLVSIFPEEIQETDNEINIKLEALLSETWGFLIDTDVRQPYIINWNNSLGQKTILKALCIDSRNILFGPKWGHNMPKFAANLSVAPLQPQKQTGMSSVPIKNETINVEKSVSSAWTDTFTADGQESCNTEGESSVVGPQPTDLDVFEATISSKSDSAYPSSIDIQPIRQINLPETHIYTPTDSETPRSKTTHFDCGPSVLLPQQLPGSQTIQTDNVSFEVTKEEKKIEDDDWEFQDFKSTPSGNSLTLSENYQPTLEMALSNENRQLSTPVQSTEYQSQVLQPIKMEPVLPTLNWPDPGEVKHVFDAFTDFVSNSTWSAQSSITQIDANRPESTKDTGKEAGDKITNNGDIERATNDVNNFDDDFDTFQSALPSTKKTDEIISQSTTNVMRTSPTQITNSQEVSNTISNFKQVFPKVNKKAESISFTNIPLSESISTNSRLSTNVMDSSENSFPTGLPTQSKILQPTLANTSTLSIPNRQKSDQILHPLSLESYSQINWPSPGIDLQDLSRFNPVDTLHSLKSDLSTSAQVKSSPVHSNKSNINNSAPDEDVWGEFVSSKPKLPPSQTKKSPVFNDDEEWSDFVSNSSVKPQNGLNTISLNVYTNSNMQKSVNQNKFIKKNDQGPLDVPTLNYITPKSNNHKPYNERHFQNL